VGGPTQQIVGWWLEHFTHARIIFIVRDPLMVTRAVLRARRRSGKRQTLRDLIYETVDPLRVLKAQQKLLDDQRIFAVAYEDLVDDPAAVMARIAAFLGMAYDERLARPSIFGEPVVVRTASRPSKDVFKDSADWRQGLSLRERIVVGLAGRLARLRADLRVDYPALRRRLRGG
jgi:hypothetical protein